MPDQTDGKATVLLVGADTRHRALLVGVLAPHGYRLQSADHCAAALDAMRQQLPGLVVIDLAGAEQDGLGLLAWLQADPGSAGIPVILLASSSEREARLAGLAAGADEVLALPLDGDELCLRVRNLLRLSVASPLKFTSMALQAAILDAAPANIALLDMQGVLISVNQTWRRHAGINGMAASHDAGIGSNYLAICDASTGPEAVESRQVADGIRAILDGSRQTFSIEYACDTPAGPNWFLLSVAPLGEVDRVGAIVMHLDITERQRSARKILDLNATLEKLSIQLIQAQEQERINLARELHDELGQRLALLKLNLHQLNRLLVAPEPRALWTSIDADVNALIAQIRVISVSLRPPVLDYLGLESAIGQLLQRQFSSTVTTCIFEYAGLPVVLAPAVEITIYRIVQECVTNVLRHAMASRVVVEVNGGESGYELELIIRDNGKGFDRSTLASRVLADGSRSGLPGMKERIALLGGSLSVESAPGQGTRIIATLALDKHE
ncbi:ATP-binding protein [Actimicrobium sp. CCI2.3]|uniref:ATP-binding protein n=1 Tax=Actimicrobium sp. CCI2.3 TaxID=3048616 RepID=UPI002AB363BF|nr:ATP-binding protein [Actimicrobium sp. CCI2.3]MDY7574764.1 histidine kinase [Actimicrobium sp. CCI2.3]MEB0020275.1 histidine kinase [Actimicrobium sp. CCI2.3]